MAQLMNENVASGNSVSLANYLLIQKEEQANQAVEDYKSQEASNYAARVDDVNFATDGQAITTRVNDWVKNNTKGLIKSILQMPPDPDTFALLLNAIYFKGEWEQKFSSAMTTNMTFYNKGANGKDTEFMRKLGKWFLYKEAQLAGETVQVLDLPYEADSMSMVIILPQQNDSLKTMLTSSNFASDMKSLLTTGLRDLKGKQMNLFIPKFKLESDYSLIPTLDEMGVKKVFESGEADLSGVNGKKNLFVSKIKHKAVIRVDEDGTEAAAVTMLDMYPMSASSVYVPPVDFRVDHPFLFLIRNKETGLVLFMGKVEEL